MNPVRVKDGVWMWHGRRGDKYAIEGLHYTSVKNPARSAVFVGMEEEGARCVALCRQHADQKTPDRMQAQSFFEAYAFPPPPPGLVPQPREHEELRHLARSYAMSLGKYDKPDKTPESNAMSALRSYMNKFGALPDAVHFELLGASPHLQAKGFSGDKLFKALRDTRVYMKKDKEKQAAPRRLEPHGVEQHAEVMRALGEVKSVLGEVDRRLRALEPPATRDNGAPAEVQLHLSGTTGEARRP